MSLPNTVYYSDLMRNYVINLANFKQFDRLLLCSNFSVGLEPTFRVRNWLVLYIRLQNFNRKLTIKGNLQQIKQCNPNYLPDPVKIDFYSIFYCLPLKAYCNLVTNLTKNTISASNIIHTVWIHVIYTLVSSTKAIMICHSGICKHCLNPQKIF